MAVTATFVRASDYRLFYAIQHDGAAGDQILIDNATLQANAAGKPHILKVLQTVMADDAAAVRWLMAGEAAVVRITPGSEAFWSVDAQANTITDLPEIVVDGQAGTVNDGLLELQVLHTINK